VILRFQCSKRFVLTPVNWFWTGMCFTIWDFSTVGRKNNSLLEVPVKGQPRVHDGTSNLGSVHGSW
jgi:hypothetical protein